MESTPKNDPQTKPAVPVSPKLTDQNLIDKNARAGFMVLGVIILMIGLSFASVPLYKLYCERTGFDGTPLRATELPAKTLDRKVTIKFNADVGPGLQWDFKPEVHEITIKLGEKGLTAFHTRNREAKSVGGTALYNVTPFKVAKYFHKIQCFCFDEQVLKPGEDVSMPVLFFVDPAMNDDPNMADVSSITLSYTFYRAESNELEDALEGFYNEGASVIKGSKKTTKLTQ